jgi:hypothetical protein
MGAASGSAAPVNSIFLREMVTIVFLWFGWKSLIRFGRLQIVRSRTKEQNG